MRQKLLSRDSSIFGVRLPDSKYTLGTVGTEVLHPSLTLTVILNSSKTACNHRLMHLQNVVNFGPSPALHCRDKYFQDTGPVTATYTMMLNGRNLLPWGFSWNVYNTLLCSLMKVQVFFKAQLKCYFLCDFPLPPCPHAPQKMGGFFALHCHSASMSTMTGVLVFSTGKQKSIVATSWGLEPAHIEAWTPFPPVVFDRPWTCPPCWVSVS